MDHDRDLPTRLCLFGDGHALLDCFEQIRQAGAPARGGSLAGASLAAAPLDEAQTPAHSGLAASEARQLGIDWHDDPAGMLAGGEAGLVLVMTPGAVLPCPLPGGWRLFAAGEARVFWGMLVRAACPAACRPDLARARRLLSGVLDRLDDEIALLGPGGRVLDANAKLAARLGQPREALAGLAASEVFPDFPDLDAPGVDGRPSVRQALDGGHKARRQSSRLDGRGRLRYFRTAFYPVPGQEGLLDHVAVVRRDITQDVFLERRLQKSERLAAIGELSMFISHEIRNPLFAIAGFANALLRAKDLGEASREKASIILKESKRLDDILKDIINFSRPTTSNPGEVDLGEVARRTTALMRHALEGQGIAVTLDISPETPMARGDPETLTQCLINCLKNAMEAMPEGGHVVVATGLEDGRAYLSVRDDGPGIPAEVLPNVFNPFFTTRDKRAGLGLAMTKKILEDLGGTVELASRPGEGATVRLLLPSSLELIEEET
ncbi:MAG: two-component system sensor histidine kinase NtrB [Solidesulfovibrio sp. DCME]|uniref:two-component system sensor histidine kinase NtrB n=1 Tax=Solidesulfovibrio sp. DCME TaxID=3447380 RepID=UPI003D0F31EA